MADRFVYMDNFATTPVDPRVLETMRPYYEEQFGNSASTNHMWGQRAADAVTRGRSQVAALLGVPAKSLVFTSGATESNNLALKGAMLAAGRGGHLITTAAEHRAVLDPAKRLQRAGFSVTVLPVDRYGAVDPEQVARAITEKTVMVSILFANNEVGTINPIHDVGMLCRERGVLLHTDAAQAVGKIAINLSSLPVDLASISAHKLYGPQGVGALYVRRDGPRIPIEPFIDGGGHEGHLRSGTLPVALIAGFGEACNLAADNLVSEQERLTELRARLWDGLCLELDGLVENGHPQQRLAGNLNVSFERVDGEALLVGLKRLAVSSGSACTTADPGPSHVLRAMGISDELSRSSLRFGLGRFNNVEDVDLAIEDVVDVVRRLRGLGSERSI
jgi:cysteine desulfurase